MALTLVTGRANAGKTGAMHAAALDAASAGRSPSLLLPTGPDVARTVSELSAKAPLGVRVDVFDSWIGEMWSLHGDGRVPIGSAQRSLLAGRVVARTELAAAAASSGTAGFARAVALLARRVAEEPRAALDRARPRTAADAEIVRILAAYREALDALGLIEPAEAARLLSEATPPIDGPVLVHRFSDLSPSQEALLVAAAMRTDVWVSLPWEEGFPATEATGALVDRLAAHGEHRHLPMQIRAGDPELDRFEDGIFRAPEPRLPGGAVRFCTAAGAEAEAALVASEAARAAARFGPERVAVVFRDASEQVAGVRRALAGAGVPADVDVLVPALRTPLGASLARLLHAVRGEGGRECLVEFLRGPFSGAEHDAVDRLDARLRARPETSMAATLAGARELSRGTCRVIDLARRTSRESTADNWQLLADTLLGQAHDASSMREDGDAVTDAAAHRAILEAVSGLCEIGGGRAACEDVLGALAAARIPVSLAERPGRLQVTEAHRLRGRRFDAVIVAGMSAQGFSAEGRASAAEQYARRLVGDSGPADRLRERLLFYMVCTRARRLLVLIRRVAGSEGEPESPSVFWEEALDLYRHPAVEADGEATAGIVSERFSLSDLESAAPALGVGRAALRAAASCLEPDHVCRSERLRDDDTLEWLARRDAFSATELESYARCPYRWFYERALRPQGIDLSIDARSHGELAHRALAILYEGLTRDLGAARVTPQNLPTALELADGAFARACSRSTPAAVTLAEADDRARVRLMVRRLVTSDARFLPGFEPVRGELRFGDARGASEAEDGASVTLEAVDLGGFRLRGSIDRVDAGEAGLAVVDYKSGEVPTRAQIERERRIQVPLYAVAARELLGAPVVAGLYRSLRSGAARGFHLAGAEGVGRLVTTDAIADTDALERLLEDAVATARAAADGIRAGDIPSRPCSARACLHCPASALCARGR